MTASKHSKKSLCLFGILLLTACQPSTPNVDSSALDQKVTADTPVTITDDSVIMAPEHILTIKSSRYQPSLGLQGRIEPIQQTRLIAAHSANIQEILVNEGQWVEKGAPLFIVKRISKTGTAVNPQVPIVKSTASKDGKGIATDATRKTEESLGDEATLKNEATAKTKATQTKNDDNETDDNTVDIGNDGGRSNLDTNGEAVKTSDLAEDDNTVSEKETLGQSSQQPVPEYKPVTITASFSGRIETLPVKAGENVDARTPLLEMSDETKLHFMATLPIQAEPQLSVGQNVNFTAEKMLDKFTGQVSQLIPTSQPKKLLVYVNVIDNEDTRDKLLPNMKVTGRVNYGQIEVGTIVPKRALHNVDLSELKTPPYIPLRPLAANVWIIGQDQRLTRQPIEVVEYDPSTQQYLIAGVSNDSLICLADLPTSAEGKKVVVS